MSRFKRPAFLAGGAILVGVLVLVVAGGTAAQFENHDTFCSSCHTEPETTYVGRANATSAVDLASFHTSKGVRCIDCHAGKGLGGRIGALSLGARDTLRYVTGHYAQPSPLTRAIGDIQCAKCHGDVGESQSFQNHFHVFLPEWQRQSSDAASCVSCHEGHQTDGNVQIGFLNEGRTTLVCEKCHSFAGQTG